MPVKRNRGNINNRGNFGGNDVSKRMPLLVTTYTQVNHNKVTPETKPSLFNLVFLAYFIFFNVELKTHSIIPKRMINKRSQPVSNIIYSPSFTRQWSKFYSLFFLIILFSAIQLTKWFTPLYEAFLFPFPVVSGKGLGDG